MIRVDEWTDFEAHDIAELALSVSDEIHGISGRGTAELARLDAWLDEAIEEGIATRCAASCCRASTRP